MDINVQTIEKLNELAEPNIVCENGYTYSDKDLELIRAPKVDTVKLTTLNSLAAIVRNEFDVAFGSLVVHIDGENHVSVLSRINSNDRSREIPYVAKPVLPESAFNCRMDYEQMMIALKSKFIETPELLELVQLLGTIVEENHTQIADDGFTQTVTVRQGIAVRGNKAINPIVKLKPYRTFLELEQPESKFLVRLFEGGQVAIFEADGGAWKLEARKRICEYLSDALADLIEIGKVIVIA